MEAAWDLVHEEGLAGLSLRDLASRAGISTPTVYAYFESKNAIYDAMFCQAATEFAELVEEPSESTEPEALMRSQAHRFVDFCMADAPRYYLLFQRTIPEFEPSSQSYAPAVRALDATRDYLALNGITQPRFLDLWTALLNGLADQQVSNDPGGDRGTRLVDEAVTMFISYCDSTSKPRKSQVPAKKAGR